MIGDITTGTRLAFLFATVMFACDSSESETGEPADAATGADADAGVPETRGAAAVITELTFVSEQPAGVSEGMNLDDFVTTRIDDPVGCGRPDMTSPEGVTGIDNQLAKLMPALDAVGGAAITGLVQNAINSGELLLVVNVEQIEDRENDSAVTLSIVRGAGAPLLGADSRILSGQTFDKDYARSTQTVAGAITDGRVQGGPVDLWLDFNVFDVHIDITARNGIIRATLNEDGTMDGILAGALSVDNLIAIATAAGDELVANLARDLAPSLADLTPDADGNCTEISVAIAFHAEPAWFFDDEGSGAVD